VSEPLSDCPDCYGRPRGLCPNCGQVGPEPESDSREGSRDGTRPVREDGCMFNVQAVNGPVAPDSVAGGDG
jgi:hypothetical protein